METYRLRRPLPAHRPSPLFLQLYALDTVLPDLGTPEKPELERAMRGHVLDEAVLMGTYQRTKL